MADTAASSLDEGGADAKPRKACLEMDAALGLGEADPAAGAKIRAGRHAGGAGHAADREEPVRLQRMGRQVALGQRLLDARPRPAGERVDLDPAIGCLERLERAAQAAVVARAAGNP